MVVSFIEYMGWLSLSPNLKESFEKAQHVALDLNHGHLDIPHLLYALIDNPEAAIVLSAHHIDRQSLRHHIVHHDLAFRSHPILENGVLSNFTPKKEIRTEALQPTKRIKRLMAVASQKAEEANKSDIDGEDVIKALITIEKEISNHYSDSKRDIKQDATSSYKYQEDLFSYDQHNRLTSWKHLPKSLPQSLPQSADFSSELYLSQPLQDQKKNRGYDNNCNGSSPQDPQPKSKQDQLTGSDKNMKYSYPANNTIEHQQIKSSLDSLMERRADAEEVLQDCEWYQLLKNLEQVSDNLDETIDRHQKKLVRKARMEIDKVDRWRKAYHYIKHLDDELAKFRALEESSLREEKHSKDIVFVELEDREMARAIEERMHMLEKHVNQLERKLKSSKKSKKHASHTQPVSDDSYGHAPAVSDYYLESLKAKIETLESHIDKQDYRIATLKDQTEHQSKSNPELEREKVTLKHELTLVQRENDSLSHKISSLENNMSQQDALIVSLRDQSNQHSASRPEFEREKATLKHEVSMLQTENEGLTHRVAELETSISHQEGNIVSLRDKASRRKERLNVLSSQHDSIIPALEQEKETLKHEISMLQDENDKHTHRIAELETQHHSLSEEFSGSSAQFTALQDSHDRIVEKNDKRKQYILSLEEQIKGLESNNQRQDKLVIDLHGEVEGYKTSVEANKETIAQLLAQINSHKDSTHLLAQEKLTLDERLKSVANESDVYGQKSELRKQKIIELEQKIKAHEEFSNTREQRVKVLQTEINSSNEVLNSFGEKLNLQKEKAASRERHVRTLELHVKAQENEIAVMKKQMAVRPAQAAVPVYAAPGRRSTVPWRDTDSLVEIVRASM